MTERTDYRLGELEEMQLADSPIVQLQRWVEDAARAKLVEPSAMCVSSVGPDGRPSARYVLLRGLDERGLVFFTNYESRKGVELATNPFVAVTFWWGLLERQVRVEGRVERTSDDESDAYFESRPRDSQLASSASPQSRPVENREALEALVKALAAEYEGEPVPRPDHWGGFRIVPDRFEFWHGRRARLHDRVIYEIQPTGWTRYRIAP